MPDVALGAPDGVLPAYAAVPPGEGPWPGVVVVHDGFGLTRDIRRIADRLAASGYLVIAPALYRRGNRVACVVRAVRSLRRGEGPAVRDLLAARDSLVADPRCTGRVGSIGFCIGGGFCLLLAPTGAFDAAAPTYGIRPGGDVPLERSCPMVASYGARDRPLRGEAARLEGRLAAAGVPHDVKEYPDVGHAFMNDWDTPGVLGGPVRLLVRAAGVAYSEPEAEDAWGRILSFFSVHLG